MPVLIPVQYGRMKYPEPIHPQLVEVAAHFDKESIPTGLARYSLHTEYSASARKLSSGLLKRFDTLSESQSEGVPRLWRNPDWAKQFAGFVVALVGENRPPEILEIHPPFKSDCPELGRFLDLVFEFQATLPSRYSETKIVLENRYGSRLSSRFLVSRASDVVAMANSADRKDSPLGLVVDVPQILHAEGVDPSSAPIEDLRAVLEQLGPVTNRVTGIHLWARSHGGGTHTGDLDEYFGDRPSVKMTFLTDLGLLLGDSFDRYFVPEVNYGRPEVLEPMIWDLMAAGFSFQA